MFAKAAIATLKSALVLGAVILLDDMLCDKLPPWLMSFLPTWVWLLPLNGDHMPR